jgi:hypothetical protein
VEVGAEEADPEECCLLGEGRQGVFYDIGCLVFALRYKLAMIVVNESRQDADLHRSEGQMYQKASCQRVRCAKRDVPRKKFYRLQWQC